MRLSEVNKLILLSISLALAACNGGGGGGSSSDGDTTATSQSLTGGGIKGPLVNAIVTVYEVDPSATDFKGAVVGTPGSTGAQAQIQNLALPFPLTPPYILEFSSDENTTDILTGQFPVISEMRTVITAELLNAGDQIYATPLTTMAVDLAIKNADVDTGVWATDERNLDPDGDGTDDFSISLGDSTVTADELLTALPIAAAQVKSTMGFGMDEDIDLFDTPPLIDNTTDNEAKQEQAAAYRAAVEAVTAVVSQIDDATGTDDANSVLSSLTADLADGQIDGKFDDENGEQQNSEIFGGTDDDAEETATAALQLLEQDPATLPIPNDPLGRTVGQMKQVINDEKEELGHIDVVTEIETTEEVELKPAETNPDLDGDGVPNDKDAFPEDDSETKDTDKDGLGNNADTDDDNDGVADENDAFPLNPAEQKDTDNDGIGNNADTDDDGDGVEDSADDFPLDATRQNKADQDNDGWPSEQDSDDNDANVPGTTFVDTDGDGVADGTNGVNGADTDDDNDGVENSVDAFPRDATEQKDTDGDGIGDNADTDIDGDGVANADDKFPRNPFETKDTDRDGIGNNTDEDDDGDGIDDAQEVQNGTDPLKRDTDGDGVLDNADQAPTDPEVQFDSDKDGIDNKNDNCPVHYNPSQSNIDGDARGDACDKDKDGDGVENPQDAFPEDSSETLDTDGDGIGNNEDTDDDNDGVADVDDAFPLDATETKDTDGDGTGDNADTDRDGDGVDNTQDAFPNDPSEDTDTDGDGIGNNTDDDIDGDGIANDVDDFPLNASASADTDGDGEPNNTDTDDDGDGVDDVNDAFPLNANETTDTDGDGIGDNADGDIDGDGVANDDDRFPFDKNEYLDTDGDGTGDNADTDRDGDGTDNSADAFPLNPSESIDTDGDGIGNNADTDDDNDGLSDTQEAVKLSNPLLRDTDSDGRRDGADNCPINANADQKDRDGDGQGDACDADDDGDSIEDDVDNCPLTPNANQNDQDSDGKGDVCDTDRDGDSVLNSVDNCPTTENADQLDANNNGIGDACDADADQDGVVDELDNCPADANPDQLDTDSDKQGNVCDTDDDNDGLTDTEEAEKGTNPLKADTDNDGVNDKNDAFPTDPSETKDTDGDGTGDNADNNKDTDSHIDSEDNCPLINNEDQLDTDSDGKGDVCDNDDDGDGVNDSADAFPLDPAESQDQDGDQIGDKADNCPLTSNNDQADSDQDGKGDACDNDNDNDGVADAVDNCPAVPNPGQLNKDGDEQGDVCDTDDDNDNVEDSADNCPLVANEDQANQDGDAFGDACDSDRDGDGLSNADENALGTDPDAVDSDEDGTNDGADNCPATPNSDQANTDGDTKGNACDADDDNDGVLDGDDAFPEDANESADSDSDTIGDNADNCPVTANQDQADADNDGVGDVCDDLPQVATFYLNERIVDSETETDDTGVEGGVCPFDTGDEMTRVSLWLQDGAAIKVSFGDDGLNDEGSEVAIDTSGAISAVLTESHENESGSMDLTITVDGQLDSDTGVITATVQEEFIYSDSTDTQVASCVYSSTETFTPMSQAQASTIFDGQSGTNVGFVWMDAWEDHNSDSSSDSTASMASSFEFSYGIIDDTDENEFVYDASASTADKWMLHTDVESSFMLGATGWVSVADQHIVEGTPGATMNLVAKDASENILANWLVTPFSATVTNEPMLGLVPRAWSEEGLTAPQEVFAGSDVLALGIHAVSQLDVYEVRCPEHDDMGEADSTLDCQNAMLKSDGADGLTYATGLGDIIHSPGSAMTQKWQGVPAGYMEEGEVFAYLTGSDASGAEASTGSASFYRYDWEADGLIDLGVVSSWTIVDPNDNDTDLLIKFTLPELVSEQFEGGDKPDAMIVALLEDTSDSQLYVRGGHFREAGRNFYESGLNNPAIEEVKGNFSYVGDTDGDGIKDDEDTDDDGDGVEDSEDAFPLDPNESKDTDGDGTGDNADTDDDGDGVSDEDELQNGTDPLLADTDEDGVNDDTDNCPTIANGANEDNQADSDSNGIGDACDGSADVSGFWKIQRTITSVSHSGDTSWCEGDVDDVEAALVLIKQDGANIDILFADNEFQADGDIGTVNAAAELNWSAEDNFNEYFNTDGSFSGSVEDTWSFSGTADDASSPMVITDTNAVEVNILYDGEDQTGSILSNCEFTYTASMTRMNQVNAADVLAAAGTHQGMVYTESDHQYIFETDEDVFEFGYGLIDTTNGEQGFEWNDVDQTWDQFTPDADYMLSALGWGEVEDRIQVNGTPAETADLVVTDGVTIFSTMRIKTFEAMLNGLPYDGFVEEDLLDNSFDPSGMFADADSKAIAIEAENLTDAYRIPCDVNDSNYQDLGLACTNAYIKDWSNWPTISQTDLAISLADALHATSAVSDIDDKGLWIGRTHGGDNAKSVYAFLTGSDTSGATGTSGIVSFTTHFFDGETYHVDAIQDQSSDITATWEITEPHTGFQVLSFDIPEALFEEFDIEWREDPTVIMAAVEAGDTQSFLRFGGMRPAGKTETFQLLNFTALEEVIAGFNYVRPDTDNDDVSDDEDNCPTEPNTDQTDTNDDGKGDACDGGGTADEAFTAENVEGDFLISFPDNGGYKTPYTFNSDGTGVVLFQDAPSDESFTWTLDVNTLVLLINTSEGQDLDRYTLTSGSVDNGEIEAVVDEGNNGSIEATVTATWERASASSDSDNDGVENSVDNCPFTPNGVNEDNQANYDGDEFGDACDADIDGDGTANESDPCPNDEFDQCSTSSSDSDNDGVNDDLDPFPYNPNETADSDEDGLGDNQDDFPNDASEQFDTDGDGVGDNSDLCPLVASSSDGVNHNDTDSNGIGDECDISVADLAGIWLLTGDPDDTNEIPDETGESCVTDEDTGIFYSRAQIKQVGTQVWMHLEEDTFVGTIAANGDFSLVALHDDTPTEISGNYDGANFTGFGYIESETVTSGSCTGMGTLAMTMGTEVSEELVLTSGVSWFESDSYGDSSEGESSEFFYGTLVDGSVETMSIYNKETQSWETDTATDTNNYLTDNGTSTADDRFAVNGYVDDVSGETAIIQPTDQGTLVSFEIAHVDFMELELSGLPMMAFLDDGYRDGISEFETFLTGAKGYIATITEQMRAYSFWCDEDWDEDWFTTDQSMTCNNIVSIGSVEGGTNTDGSTDYDPVPATSFDEVISTPSELSAMTDEVRSRGLWAGNGDNFQIKAYLLTDDGTSTGANPTVIFMKDFWNGSLFKVGEGSFSNETVGSSAIITWSVPDFVRQLGDRDHDEGDQFIFVDQDIIDGAEQNVLRHGEVRLENTVEHEFLFDANAKEQIISVFALMSPQPQAFLDASDNGVNFATGSDITMDQTFGVAGFGLLREWDTDTGSQVYEYYTFDVSGDGGRYVFEEKDDTGSVIDSADEAMTWSVNVEGNLEIIITSSSEEHAIALAEFGDTYRPQVVVLNAFEASEHSYSERMVSQTTFEAEVANRIDLSTEPLDDTSFTYINKNPDATEVETMIFNADGSWEWQIDTVTDELASWSVNTTDNYILLDLGDGTDTLAIEDIFADINDLDGDSDTTENIYLFTGWYEVDGTTGLGSFFRDEFYKN